MSIEKLDPENIATPAARGEVEKTAKNNLKKEESALQNQKQTGENESADIEREEPEDANTEAIDEDDDLTKERQRNGAEDRGAEEPSDDNREDVKERAFYRTR